MSLKTLTIFTATFLLIPAALADHAFPVGQILEIEGKASLTHADKTSAAKAGDQVHLNDTVITDEGSKALIMFIDDTNIILSEDTELLVDTFIFDPEEPAKNEGKFDFLKGAFLWTSGQIAAAENPKVKLETPVGSIGIRGTVVWGGTLSEKYGVFVQDGSVEYSGEWGSAILNKNDGIFVSKTEILRDVKQWGQPMVEAAVTMISFTDIDAVEKTLEKQKTSNIERRENYKAYLKSKK